MTVTGRTSTFLQRVLKSTVHGSLGKGMSRTNADGPGIDTVSVVRPLLFLDFQMNSDFIRVDSTICHFFNLIHLTGEPKGRYTGG